MSCNVVCSLWGCHHVDWCCLDSKGALGGVLIMWDRRIVEKIDECMGEFSLTVTFRNVDDHFTWAFAGALIPIGIEGSFWMTWLVYFAGATCLVALR
jgi:hypothetical protein